MRPEQLPDLSLVEAASAIQTGSLTAVEYAGALLARIDQVDSRIQAWVTIHRDAVIEEARACDREAREKRFRGPLHGIPVGIKDIFYTQGLRTTMGSSIFADFVPDRDAQAVTNLKRAGAIVLGKTVTTVFANLDPGPTRNPWNLAHTPGGSSSGSAAAVAARMCPAAIGSQTVGSVGRPAAFNGLVSLVPQQNRISLESVFPLAWSLDHVGMFARSVADIELMYAAMAGTREAGPVGARRGPLRIGVVRDFFYENATAEARSLNDALANQLAAARFEIEEARLPSVFDLSAATLRTILRSETASIHEQLFREHPEGYGPKLRALIETGMLVEAADYVRARRVRRRYQREMAALFEKFDVLMTPPARGTAPEGIGSTGDPVMNGPWTLSDFPTMTLPHALGSNGLPIGVQFSGPPGQEEFLLGIVKEIETVIDFRETPLSS
jgi:aspartyl-tRNA(Asn)/glutamyl-tRNA(Gln) amidotransferase subunit A